MTNLNQEINTNFEKNKETSEFESLAELFEAFPTEQHFHFCPSNNQYKCKNTNRYFNVKTKTIFSNTKLPLWKWFQTLYLFSISSISTRNPKFETMLKNVIEIDEAFSGAAVERESGNMIANVSPDTKLSTLEPMVEANIEKVNHSAKQYAKGEVSVNGVENHEFVFRNNTRNYSIKERFDLILSSSIVGVKLPCYILEDGTRVFSASETQKVLKMIGTDNIKRNSENKLKKNSNQKSSKSLIDKEKRTSNLEIISCHKGDIVINCYEATMLVEICQVFSEPMEHTKLSPKQKLIIEQHEMLFNSFAKVGINALIDEATGYQQERGKEELRALTEAYILSARIKELISKTDKDKFIKHLEERYHSQKELGKREKI
ncbi:13668_t:CDS:2 [Funneliformis geosporum]|nr:13668_t:CDS:2 [Funneliformis geosporum]